MININLRRFEIKKKKYLNISNILSNYNMKKK